jgi:hypothetical protein
MKGPNRVKSEVLTGTFGGEGTVTARRNCGHLKVGSSVHLLHMPAPRVTYVRRALFIFSSTCRSWAIVKLLLSFTDAIMVEG